jgi:hypothetical protein
MKIAFWARIAPDLIICVCTLYLYTFIINIYLSNMFVEASGRTDVSGSSKSNVTIVALSNQSKSILREILAMKLGTV